MTSSDSNSSANAQSPADMPPVSANFIRARLDMDVGQGVGQSLVRPWRGKPGLRSEQLNAPLDFAKIRTRFPPEPNGHLHIGHAKSIWLNFSLANDYGGRCHLRFDDTNPEKENQEYVDSIIDAVRWLGFHWSDEKENNLYYTSDYFDYLYRMAEWLITAKYAYVDSQSSETLRLSRGTLSEPGVDSPYRDRSTEENLRLLKEMRDGVHPEGAHVVRAKIDMQSPNISLRDPILYRIRHTPHHRAGSRWNIFPMYDFAHPVADALENITHSICTLEFENHRPLYNWILERLVEGGFFSEPKPQQIEFARLNLTYIITSKRKLNELVMEKIVDSWDDPRMPTIAGLRRRGYTPEAIRLFCHRSGVSKSDAWLDYGLLEQALRDDLEDKAPRATAVIASLKLTIINFPEGKSEPCSAPIHPLHPERGENRIFFTRHLWIEQEDFAMDPPKGFFRLSPGSRVRLRHGYVIECTGYEIDESGTPYQVFAQYFPDSKSGTAGANNYKVKGNIHWLSQQHCFEAEVRLYDRLFMVPHPDDKDFRTHVNPKAKKVVRAKIDASLKGALTAAHYQFERLGYFVADCVDSRPGAPVFNLSAPLKDTWGKTKRP